MTWTSTFWSGWGVSSQWDFIIDDEVIGPEAKVFLEACQGSSCQTVETTIDISSVALAAAKIEVLTCTDGLTVGRDLTCLAEVSGDVGFVMCSHTEDGVSWNRDHSAAVSLQNALAYQDTWKGNDGDHEVTLTVCTLKAPDPRRVPRTALWCMLSL